MTIKQRATYQVSFQQATLHSLSRLFMLCTVVVLIGGGIALLQAYQQGQQISRAAGDVSVVGQPTLRAATIDAIFARLGSPMTGTGKLVEQASRQTNIDDAFAMGVWWTETNDGAAGVGLADRNPGSVRGSTGYPSAFDGYTIYPSYTAAITYWFNMLRNNYVDGRGLSTVYTIARPYVGTTSYPLWAGKVINLMYSYRGIAPPPPTVTSTPSPTPTIDPSVVVANLDRQYQRHKLTQLLLLRPNSASSLLPGQGLAQEIYMGRTQAESTPVLPRPVELAIVLFGLLAALAIALSSFKLKAGVARGTWQGLSLPTQERTDVSSVSVVAGGGWQGQALPLHMAAGLAPASLPFSAGPPYPQSVEVRVPSTDDLPVLPMFIRLPVREDVLSGQISPTSDGGFAPSTDDLPVLPVSASGLLPRKRVTEALPRRVTLLPSQARPRTAVTAHASSSQNTRSGGLLSRYRENNSNQGRSYPSWQRSATQS